MLEPQSDSNYMKTLIIINGVTGAIGTACLARFSREDNVTIYGLSRRAEPTSSFARNQYLPDNSLICTIGDISNKNNCERFVMSIDDSLFERIVYVHTVGVYPFEMDAHGDIKVSHDDDGDGIDDRVVDLSYNAFFAMTGALRKVGKPLNALIFGSVADRHHPAVHKSWWSVMERIKSSMKEITEHDRNSNFFVLNISSVICPHEILTRPFVFQNTNANPRFWLMPHEVAEEVAMMTLSDSHKGFVEQDLFHIADYYSDDYFTEDKFTNRKKAELGI
jgi:hypothetical protein